MGWVWSLQKLACRPSVGHPHPRYRVLQFAAICLIERAAMPPLQQMQATRCPCPFPGSAFCPCQMASGCYRVLSLGVLPGWLSCKVQQCPSVPRARASSLFPGDRLESVPCCPLGCGCSLCPPMLEAHFAHCPMLGSGDPSEPPPLPAPVGLFAIFETKQGQTASTSGMFWAVCASCETGPLPCTHFLDEEMQS